MDIHLYLAQCEKQARMDFYRACIKRYCGQDFFLAKDLNGKPFLMDTPTAIGITHKENTVMVALSEVLALGVDIEVIKPYPKALSLAKRFFSTEEYEALMTLTGQQQAKLFFAMWTAKEALLKRMGWVLPRDLKSAYLDPVTLQPKTMKATIKHIYLDNQIIAIAAETLSAIILNDIQIDETDIIQGNVTLNKLDWWAH